MFYFRLLGVFLVVISYPVIAQENQSYVDGSVRFIKNHDNQKALEDMSRVNDTLYDVLALAYQDNSTIKAARLELLAFQEQLEQAESGYKPTITADADVTYSNTESKGDDFMSSDGGNLSKSASLNFSHPVYRGGTIKANIERVQNLIAAQQYQLSAIEQATLYQAVNAYMVLYRDRAVLNLRENNQQLIEKELEQAQARFEVGEITRTDVSQSEARLASARADVINAQAEVQTAIASFIQVVGNTPPEDMGYPMLKFEMPQTLDGALELARTNNRDVLQAIFNKQAAAKAVESIKGELKPQVNAVGRLQKTYDQSDFVDEQRQAVLGLNASVPLYTGGATRSRIREGEKLRLQRVEQVNIVQDRVQQEVVTRWQRLTAARAETKARLLQIEAASIAQEGVHYETEFGERTTLDALNANQELLSAQVELVKSKQNEIIAQFFLAERLGLLVPKNLGFSTITP